MNENYCCPICDTQMKLYGDMHDMYSDYTLECPNKCYSVFCGYGLVVETIEGEEFSSSYRTGDNEYMETYNKVQAAIKHHRETYSYLARILATS